MEFTQLWDSVHDISELAAGFMRRTIEIYPSEFGKVSSLDFVYLDVATADKFIGL